MNYYSIILRHNDGKYLNLRAEIIVEAYTEEEALEKVYQNFNVNVINNVTETVHPDYEKAIRYIEKWNRWNKADYYQFYGVKKIESCVPVINLANA